MKLFARLAAFVGAAAFIAAGLAHGPAYAAPKKAKTVVVHGFTRKTKAGKIVTVHGYTRKAPAKKVVHVHSFTRVTKTGKVVHVKAHTRAVPGAKKKTAMHATKM